jgi:hypothetical protein
MLADLGSPFRQEPPLFGKKKVWHPTLSYNDVEELSEGNDDTAESRNGHCDCRRQPLRPVFARHVFLVSGASLFFRSICDSATTATGQLPARGEFVLRPFCYACFPGRCLV